METKIEIGSWRDNEMNIKDFKWTREPDDYTLTDDKIEIITQLMAQGVDGLAVKNLLSFPQ